MDESASGHSPGPPDLPLMLAVTTVMAASWAPWLTLHLCFKLMRTATRGGSRGPLKRFSDVMRWLVPVFLGIMVRVSCPLFPGQIGIIELKEFIQQLNKWWLSSKSLYIFNNIQQLNKCWDDQIMCFGVAQFTPFMMWKVSKVPPRSPLLPCKHKGTHLLSYYSPQSVLIAAMDSYNHGEELDCHVFAQDSQRA